MESRRGEYNRWTSEERRLLIDKRIELDHLFQNNTKCGAAWKRVAAEIQDNCEGKDVRRCKSQWIYLLRKYKSLTENSSQSSDREGDVWDDKKDFEFYDTIHNYMVRKKPENLLDIQEDTFPEEFRTSCHDEDAPTIPSIEEEPLVFVRYVESPDQVSCSELSCQISDVPEEKPLYEAPEICRGCLATLKEAEQLLDWSSYVEDLSPKLSYADCFEQCTRLEAKPNFPHKICINCAFELREAFLFLEKAKKSDRILSLRLEYHLSEVASEPVKKEVSLRNVSPLMPNQEDGVIDEVASNVSSIKKGNQETQMDCDESVQSITRDIETYAEASIHESDENDFPIESPEFIDPNFPEQSTKEKVAACEFCGGQFPTKTLKKHMREAHREKNYLCHACCYTTTNKYTFKNHLKIHEYGRTKNHACELCGRAFYLKEKLETHMKVHDANREAKYKCDLCNKKFFYRGSLSTHKNIHAGVKIDCGICGKSFVRRGDYKIHMLSHTGEKPFKCEICGGGFTKTFTYKRHMLQHTDHRYTCEVCGADFKHESSLRVHKVRHSGFLPLMCLICQKGFVETEKVKRHLRGVHNIYDREELQEAILKKNVPVKNGDKSDEDDYSDFEKEEYLSEIENEELTV